MKNQQNINYHFKIQEAYLIFEKFPLHRSVTSF